MKNIAFALFISLLFLPSLSQRIVEYPHPVNYFTLQAEEKTFRMAYMDVRPESSNGKTVLLLHGKNFNGYYWHLSIPFLVKAGYRVIVPDQVGWGKSDKPSIHYSFHALASQTKMLLDTLGLSKVIVVGHSMGGMLATRFTLLYPTVVDKLVLENPIGLEDYRAFVPYQSIDKVFAREMKADYDSLKKYQQSYYPAWKPEYEQYVAAQQAALQVPDVKQATYVSALTYAMINEQPVVYEFKHIHVPTLLIIGQEDRTIVGKNLLSKEEAGMHGNYHLLGKWLQQQIPGSKLVELPGVGHIPHIQVPEKFEQALMNFLR